MCLSKGIPADFCPWRNALQRPRARGLSQRNRDAQFYHGHSYTGNALACAAANASLQIFADEPVFEGLPVLRRSMRSASGKLRKFAVVGDHAAVGTMGAIELRTDDAGYLSAMRPKLYRFFLERGVLLRPLGNVVYVLPPYVISVDELHRVWDVITEAIETLF
jgi:adenosylmethionine-8-amino-7-oxononanoate aminotransferase